MIEIRCKAPDKYTPDELEQFSQLVKKGKEVSEQCLESRIANAEKLATAWADDQLIAVGAIKRPLISYQKKVFAGAGVDEVPSNEYREIGWLFTIPKQRGEGVGKKIMKALVNALPNLPCFATTRTDNEKMNCILPKFGLQRSGVDYANKNSKYMLRLFLKRHD